jgi:hypothetical protein
MHWRLCKPSTAMLIGRLAVRRRPGLMIKREKVMSSGSNECPISPPDPDISAASHAFAQRSHCRSGFSAGQLLLETRVSGREEGTNAVAAGYSRRCSSTRSKQQNSG